MQKPPPVFVGHILYFITSFALCSCIAVGQPPLLKLQAEPKGTTRPATQPIIIMFDVSPLKQTKKNDCWAVVLTMLQNWKHRENKSVPETIKKLGNHFEDIYTSDDGMDDNDKKALASELSLHIEYGQSFMPDTLQGWLHDRGPLWFTVKGKDNNSHANLVVGMSGTGDYDKTFIHTIDPADGRSHVESFLDFIKRYEPAADFEGTWLYIISFSESSKTDPKQ